MAGALPVPQKTWDATKTNMLALSTSTNGRNWMFILKNSLKTLAAFPVTIKGSSSSTAAGMDGVDRWAAETDLVWSTNATGQAHSWIVLEFPAFDDGTGKKLQLSIDLHGGGFSAGNRWSLSLSPSAGFTGGSTTAKPTATDEVTVNSATDFCNSGSYAHRLNVIAATDGSIYHIVSAAGGLGHLWLCICKPTATIDVAPTVPGWNYPWAALLCQYQGPPGQGLGAQTVVSTYGGSVGSTNQKYVGRHGATTLNFGMEVEGGGAVLKTTGPGNVPNGITGQPPILGAGLWSNTAGCLGRYGFIPDLYFAGDAVYPGWGATLGVDDNHRQWIAAGCLLIPWRNDSQVPLAG